MMTTNTDMAQKQCKTCCMMIPEPAKRCPYCQTFQKWWVWHAQHPLFFIVMICLLATLLTLPYVHLSRVFDRGEPFEQYRSRVMVVESEMTFGERSFIAGEMNPVVAVIGTIRNDSDIPWKNVAFAVEFYDEQGNRIDVGNQVLHTLILPSHDTVSFKVQFGRDLVGEYTNHHIVVTHAHEARTWF